MSNWCRGVSKIFIVFAEYYELVWLQSVIEEEWRLGAVLEIIRTF